MSGSEPPVCSLLTRPVPALAPRVDGAVATLAMDVDEQGGLVPGYELKLNSYDLGVDIELYDAVQRLRFEHPEVRAVVLTGGDGQGVLRRREHPDAGRRPRTRGR